MESLSDRNSSTDEWAQATADTGDALLPVKAPSREVVSLRPSGEISDVGDLVLGLVDAVLTTLRTAIGRDPWDRSRVVDAALDTTWQAWLVAGRGVRVVERAAAPAVRIATDPPFLPRGWRPTNLVAEAADRWRSRQDDRELAVSHARRVVIATGTDSVLDTLDLTGLVETRVDLQDIVQSVLEELDLTELVLNNVELGRIVDAALDDIDLDALARERMDLLGLADYIIDGIDLPGIIRESTGSVASETVRSVRMQSIDADVAVQRIVDRVLLRRKQRQAVKADDVADSEKEESP